jgi:hypothetical protein
VLAAVRRPVVEVVRLLLVDDLAAERAHERHLFGSYPRHAVAE